MKVPSTQQYITAVREDADVIALHGEPLLRFVLGMRECALPEEVRAWLPMTGPIERVSCTTRLGAAATIHRVGLLEPLLVKQDGVDYLYRVEQ